MTQTTVSRKRPPAPSELEALAEVQGVQPVGSFESLCGGWPDEELEDGFEQTVRRWRNQELERAG